MNRDEQSALNSLEALAAEDFALAEGVAFLSWIMDGVDRLEAKALTHLSRLAEKDAGLTRTVLGFPWMTDNISEPEAKALQNINALAHRDLSLANNIVSLPWVMDDITETEWGPLASLARLYDSGVLPPDSPVGFRWVADELTEPEKAALYYLDELAEKDSTLGASLISLPWVQDDMTNDERWALRYLSELLDKDRPLVKIFPDMPFLSASFEPHDRYALQSLNDLRDFYPEKYRLLVEQEWMLDGLTDEEAVLVSVLSFQATLGSEEFGKLVNEHYTRSGSINLPLAGEIGSFSLASRQKDLDPETTKQVQEAVRALEDFMGLPFPSGELVVLYGSAGESYSYTTRGTDYPGRYLGSHMIVRANLARGSPTSDTSRIIIHEVAHYYWSSRIGPPWLGEGGPDFLASYVFDRSYGVSITERRKYFAASPTGVGYCNNLGISTIKKLLDIQEQEGMEKHRGTPLFICNYYLGEYLLLSLHETVGVDPLRAAFKEMYLLAHSEDRPLTEQEIYDTFRRHTPPEQGSGVRGGLQQLARRRVLAITLAVAGLK